MVKGKIEWISGPAVKASGMAASKMYEVVEVGEEKLVGEVKNPKCYVLVGDSTDGTSTGTTQFLFEVRSGQAKVAQIGRFNGSLNVPGRG